MHGWRRMVDGLYFYYWQGVVESTAYYTRAGKWLIVNKAFLGVPAYCFQQYEAPLAIQRLEGP